MSEITEKEDGQRFVFNDLGVQDYPNQTGKDCVVVDKSFDLTNKKILNGELVDKDADDLAAELAAKNSVLDIEYKAQRKTALMSFELAIFSDTALSDAQQADILRVRQEWFDMTSQNNYPADFVVPSLDPVLW